MDDDRFLHRWGDERRALRRRRHARRPLHRRKRRVDRRIHFLRLPVNHHRVRCHEGRQDGGAVRDGTTSTRRLQVGACPVPLIVAMVAVLPVLPAEVQPVPALPAMIAVAILLRHGHRSAAAAVRLRRGGRRRQHRPHAGDAHHAERDARRNLRGLPLAVQQLHAVEHRDDITGERLDQADDGRGVPGGHALGRQVTWAEQRSTTRGIEHGVDHEAVVVAQNALDRRRIGQLAHGDPEDIGHPVGLGQGLRGPRLLHALVRLDDVDVAAVQLGVADGEENPVAREGPRVGEPGHRSRPRP